jgi:hypothetical protein
MELEEFDDEDWTLEDWKDDVLSETAFADMRILADTLRSLQLTGRQEEEHAVLKNYTSFIRTAKEIADLQSDMTRCRALLSGLSSVLTSLREPVLSAEPATPAAASGHRRAAQRQCADTAHCLAARCSTCSRRHQLALPPRMR